MSSRQPQVRTTEGGGRVLIVEDERIVACDLAATLEDLGYEVVGSVATGGEAIRSNREQSPDVVLMDIRLTGAMDGIAAAAEITRERGVPVIYLTAHSDRETLRRAKETSPFGYLVKPFSAPELRCAIEIALHKHEIEARLRQREQWLATTLRSIGEGVVATDAARRVQLLNPIAEALTGWNTHEALGKALEEVVKLISATGDATEDHENWSSHAGRGRPKVGNALLVNRTGATVPVDDSEAPIVDEGGKHLGEVIVLRDVTEHRKSEEQIRVLNAELEARVSQRTLQLQAANRELEAFNYSVAHDLRAPLQGIEGVHQSLIEDHASKLGPEGVAKLRQVRRVTHRMSRLIDDLLCLSRVARTPLRRRRVNLSRLARLVIANLQKTVPREDVRIVVRPDMYVQGDARLLQIALENLLSNAWKFSAKTAEAKIEFGTYETDTKRAFFVRDNGVGFDMRYRDKLFAAFQRLHADSAFDGTGIGLAIVQRIVERHGGEVWAEGSEGKGATFFFSVSDD